MHILKFILLIKIDCAMVLAIQRSRQLLEIRYLVYYLAVGMSIVCGSLLENK